MIIFSIIVFVAGLGSSHEALIPKETPMKTLTRTILLCVLCLFAAATTADAQRRRPTRSQSVDATGTFSNMGGTESGDVGGTRIVVFWSLAGDREQYFVAVQQAEGVPGDPEMVRATVRGATIEFTLADGLRYTGTITAAGMRLRNSAGSSEFLRRQNCR